MVGPRSRDRLVRDSDRRRAFVRSPHCVRVLHYAMSNHINGEEDIMNRMNLLALAVSLVALPVVSHAQRPDTVKRDTVKKEGTAAKVGRQTGTSIDKAAKTTEHNAKKAGSATKTNAKHAASATETNAKHAASATETNAKNAASATKTNAKNAEKATKTNAKHLKKNVKKVTG